jgi:hypothetical protein
MQKNIALARAHEAKIMQMAIYNPLKSECMVILTKLKVMANKIKRIKAPNKKPTK